MANIEKGDLSNVGARRCASFGGCVRERTYRFWAQRVLCRVAQVIPFNSASSVREIREQLIKECATATLAFVRATAHVTERLVLGNHPTAAETRLEETTRTALVKARRRLTHRQEP